MAKVDVYNLEFKKVGDVDLDDTVFAAEVSVPAMHQVVVAQEANWRQGTHCAKNRAMVSGGGKKPFRQKGTGNARQGTTRSPLMEGGGTIFPPNPRNYEKKVTRKLRACALRSALSQRVKEGRLFVVDSFDISEPKSKVVASAVGKFGVEKALLVDGDNQNLRLGARNLKGVRYIRANGLNVRDILKYENLLMSKDSIEGIVKAVKR
jgi:large subunit ribosomal protein L4